MFRIAKDGEFDRDWRYGRPQKITHEAPEQETTDEDLKFTPRILPLTVEIVGTVEWLTTCKPAPEYTKKAIWKTEKRSRLWFFFFNYFS